MGQEKGHPGARGRWTLSSLCVIKSTGRSECDELRAWAYAERCHQYEGEHQGIEAQHKVDKMWALWCRMVEDELDESSGHDPTGIGAEYEYQWKDLIAEAKKGDKEMAKDGK